MGYIQQAQHRARRRKSLWNLLLIPAVLLPGGVLWWVAWKAADLIHSHIYAGETVRSHAYGLGPILATVAPFFAVLPLAMLIGNLFIWVVPPARRALDREAAGYPGTSFVESQKQLLKIAAYLIPLSAIVWAIGVCIPWHAQ